MAEFKRMNIRVRPEMHEWLSTNAEARGITLNAMVIFALETYIQQQMVMPLLPDMLEEWRQEQEKGKKKQ